jgi:hypothetical protein
MIKIFLIQKRIQFVLLILTHTKKMVISGLKYHNLKITMHFNRSLIIKVVYVLIVTSVLNLPIIEIIQILFSVIKQNVLAFLYILIVHLTISVLLLIKIPSLFFKEIGLVSIVIRFFKLKSIKDDF